MTTTDRRTVRVTPHSYNVLYSSRSKARPIVVELFGDKIAFREKGCRQRYVIEIDKAFSIAVRNEASRVRLEKLRKKGKVR